MFICLFNLILQSIALSHIDKILDKYVHIYFNISILVRMRSINVAEQLTVIGTVTSATFTIYSFLSDVSFVFHFCSEKNVS